MRGDLLEIELVGNGHREAHAAALELDVVVALEHVGEVAQAYRDLFASETLPLLYLEDVHQLSFVVGRVGATGFATGGEAPGCWRVTRGRP